MITIKSGNMNEAISYEDLVKQSDKKDISKEKDLGKACWQYIYKNYVRSMASKLSIDPNDITLAMTDWLSSHKSSKMNEAADPTKRSTQVSSKSIMYSKEHVLAMATALGDAGSQLVKYHDALVSATKKVNTLTEFDPTLKKYVQSGDIDYMIEKLTHALDVLQEAKKG